MGRKSNAAAKRIEIVEALYECLSQKGHETVTIKEIAVQAGVAPGAIHYYFKSKDEIVACLMEYLAEKYQSLFSEEFARIQGLEDFDERFVDFLCEEFIFNVPLNRVFYNLVQMGFESVVVQKPLQQMMSVYREQSLVRFGGPDYAFDEKGYLLVAVVEGLALQWVIEPAPNEKEGIRKIVRSLMDQLDG
ncbi:transcriptional regulator, TetR family [Desulfatibacillum aliphaticivorans]|uniref:Transcriptional regulator, TetR family n=1 Tax=Desulfatibacillum aliphaticivorans TaxID=218208 RepID=B8FK06_DESAL|nr:TetR/AcrR family transcriptional regulator [Desulfatibacillum aliphaticivorans]ACL02434.1 transcriptional regulator, TetR family [Desulfatibacillum aliphaticivorans]